MLLSDLELSGYNISPKPPGKTRFVGDLNQFSEWRNPNVFKLVRIENNEDFSDCACLVIWSYPNASGFFSDGENPFREKTRGPSPVVVLLHRLVK